MPDLIVSSDIDTLLSSATNNAARTNLELGSTDTVEFGALETSQLNFPNLSTAELNAVTDAIEGDTYFDSDRGQFVRFTGAASYEVITSRIKHTTDSVSPVSTVTLANSGFVDSGLLNAEANPFTPLSSVLIQTGASAIDGSNATSNIAYLYHDGSQGAAGWYSLGTLAPSDNVVIPANSLIVFTKNGVKSQMMSNFEIVSDNTYTELFAENLLSGSSYVITVGVSAADMLNGNLSFKSDYSGLFGNARALFTADDLQSGQRLGTFTGDLGVSTEFDCANNGPFAFDSPNLGYYHFTFKITPSSAGTLSFSVKQKSSNTLPLYINKTEISIALETD